MLCAMCVCFERRVKCDRFVIESIFHSLDQRDRKSKSGSNKPADRFEMVYEHTHV